MSVWITVQGTDQANTSLLLKYLGNNWNMSPSSPTVATYLYPSMHKNLTNRKYTKVTHIHWSLPECWLWPFHTENSKNCWSPPSFPVWTEEPYHCRNETHHLAEIEWIASLTHGFISMVVNGWSLNHFIKGVFPKWKSQLDVWKVLLSGLLGTLRFQNKSPKLKMSRFRWLWVDFHIKSKKKVAKGDFSD